MVSCEGGCARGYVCMWMIGCSLCGCTCATGFGSYNFGMTQVGYDLTGGDSTPGNRLEDIYELTATRIIGYGMCIIFIGPHLQPLLAPSPVIVSVSVSVSVSASVSASASASALAAYIDVTC